MKKVINKLQLMLKLSEELLFNFEDEDISLEKVLAKCKKLARMHNDFRALNWFILELHGYNFRDIPEGIKKEELYECAKLAGRVTLVYDPFTKKDDYRYWIESIPEIETNIHTNTIALETIKPPEQFVPSVNKNSTQFYSNETVVENYQDVLKILKEERKSLEDKLKHSKRLLSKIRNSIYNYVLNIHLQLKFENITESVFQNTKELVDKKLSAICPEAMKKFLAAYDRLKSNNPEEWSQALSSCRNVLKEFADYVYPAHNEPVTLSDGETIIVTDDKYKNRLLAFIDNEAKGNNRRLLLARAADLYARIHCLNDMLSQGVHEGIELNDVNICVIDTYLLIGSLINLVPIKNTEIGF